MQAADSDDVRLLHILRALQPDQKWLEGWDVSSASFSVDWPFFHRTDSVRRAAEYLEFPEDLVAILSHRLGDLRELGLLIWHCHRILTEACTMDRWPHKETQGFKTFKWPGIPDALCSVPELFYIYVFLASLDSIRQVHTSIGVSEEISRNTLSDLLLWIEDYHTKTGGWGLVEQSWLSTHFTGRLFKLGRLQFERHIYGHPYRAFRHSLNGKVKIIPESSDAVVVAVAADSEDQSLGSQPEWEVVLEPGDETLFVHIDATGPMDPESCDKSFERALPFFAEHFPGFSPNAFQCSSWLLDPQLRDHLSAESNIVRFLDRWQLTPEPGATDEQTIERVFGDVGVDRETWPHETTLQRSMLAHMEKGGAWKMGAGLIFIDAG